MAQSKPTSSGANSGSQTNDTMYCTTASPPFLLGGIFYYKGNNTFEMPMLINLLYHTTPNTFYGTTKKALLNRVNKTSLERG